MSSSSRGEGPDPLRSMIASLDLGTGRLQIVSGAPEDRRALVLVRLNGRVLDIVELDGAHDAAERARAAARNRTTRRGWTRGAGSGIEASVIVCTLGRNPLLVEAVKAVLAQDHGHFEVVVVDNAPGRGSATHMLDGLGDERLRIVAEPDAGLSRARNAGTAAARGEILVFTDDDAVSDPRWLPEILDVFGSDTHGAVGAVTGNPLPALLHHRAQRFFEARGGFPRTVEPVLWTLGDIPAGVVAMGRPGEGGPLYPLTTARVGAGVSMAFRREVLEEIGPFDTRLGAGTRTAGGEDLDAFARVLRAGYAIVQTPDAVVWHTHRDTLEGLHVQVRGNGTGMAALLTKTVLSDPRAALTLARRSTAVARRLAPGSPRVAGRDPDVPRTLTRTEAIGFLTGPALYLREGWQARRASRRVPR